MVHNSEGGGKYQMTEVTRRKNVLHPLLNLSASHVEAWWDDTTLIDSANKLYDNLAWAMVIDKLEITNITCKEGSEVK